MSLILPNSSLLHVSISECCGRWVTCSLVRARAVLLPCCALPVGRSRSRHDGSHRRANVGICPSKGSGEGGSYTGAFPGFPSVSADFHQSPLRALSIPGAWVLRSPDLVVVSSFRMHCTFPIWRYRWCDAFNFDPRVLGIQPCHPSGSKPAAHFFGTEVRIRDLQLAMTSIEFSFSPLAPLAHIAEYIAISL